MAKVSKERLEKVGANILGVVLNKFEAMELMDIITIIMNRRLEGREEEEEKDK